MEVKYTLEGEDYWTYNLFVINRTPSLKIRRIFSFVIAPIAIGGELLFFNVNHFIVVGATLILAVAWVVFLRWLGKYSYLKAIRSRPGQMGLHTLTISPEGVKQTSTLGESKVPWSNFTEIAESPSQLCFFLSPRFGVIVPKAAFPDADAQVFLELAQGYWGHALHGKPLPADPQNDRWPPPPRIGA